MSVPEDYDKTFPEVRNLESWHEYELEPLPDDTENPSEVTFAPDDDEEYDISTHWITADVDYVYSLEKKR